ncbi:MAG: DUF3987 domain-containing protein [Planctomycetes bacterium]|nr:DUF3987 domain-containing protein [Planctomycetota bacterium]
MGLMLTNGRYWALDLDHIIDTKSGEVAPGARRLLACLPGTYAERSPSGDGLHILFRGTRPLILSRTRAKDAFGPSQDLEVFGGTSARYLTMTGQAWGQNDSLLEAPTEAIEAILAMFPPEVPAQTSAPGQQIDPDDDQLRKVRRALKNVPADDYSEWIFVGMALKATFTESAAVAVWEQWSQKSPKFDPEALRNHWKSFGGRRGGKTVAYIFWLANQHEPNWWQQWRQDEEARMPPSGFQLSVHGVPVGPPGLPSSTQPSVSSVTSPPGALANPGTSANTSGLPSVASVSSPPGGSPDFRPLRPLPDPLSAVPAFDPALLPTPFRGWVEDIANRIQCPIDFPAVAAMVTYSAVIGRRIGVRPKQRDNWCVVSNLWGGVVGRPGVMKTPGIQEPMSFLRRLEANGKDAYDRECKEHAARSLVAKARDKVADQEIRKTLAADGDAMAVARMAIADALEPPVRRRFITNDATVEKLGEILNENPNGIIVFRDELTGLLRSLDKEGQEGARAFYLEAWNGTGAFTFDRILRGTVEIHAATVSILGGIQPGPLSSYLQAALRTGAADDGLVQRFQLLVYPDISPNWKNVDEWPLTETKQAAWSVYEGASNLVASERGAILEDHDDIPFLRLDPNAQDAFDDWRPKLEHRVRSGLEHAAIESHISKYRSLIPSLALLIHLAEGGNGPVRADAMTRAIAWAQYLEPHARRLYGLSLGNHLECRAIAKHILAGDLEDGFDARKVYRSGWSQLSDPTAVEAGLEQLIGLGWLDEQLRPTRGRTATIYRINPRIRELGPEGTDRTDRRSTPQATEPFRPAPPDALNDPVATKGDSRG